jgi:hypothetical protein
MIDANSRASSPCAQQTAIPCVKELMRRGYTLKRVASLARVTQRALDLKLQNVKRCQLHLTDLSREHRSAMAMATGGFPPLLARDIE